MTPRDSIITGQSLGRVSESEKMQPSSASRGVRGATGAKQIPAPHSSPGPIQPPATSPKRVLVVDDVPHVAQAIEALLVSYGHTVEVAADGKEALGLFKRGKYDLIITDYAMPVMTGAKLAHAVKAQSPKQRILLVTAFTFSLASQENEPVPVDMILQKPFSPNELQKAIAVLFPE
jgi:CheY-like chemotaxis protein